MITIPPICPPPPHNYVKSAAAWLRLGKIAAGVVLAGLAAAGGLAFPGAKDAAAYDGYTYTERLCQEYGQQPKRYQVRDPIPGSDWRNDGGWAIILVRSANVRRAEYRFAPLSSDNLDPNAEAVAPGSSRAATLQNVLNGWENNQQIVGADDNGVWESPSFWFIRSGTLIVAQDGTQGFVTTQYWGRAVIVDRNNNGVLDEGDMARGAELLKTIGGQFFADRRTVTRVVEPTNYGAQYVRWANLAWCR